MGGTVHRLMDACGHMSALFGPIRRLPNTVVPAPTRSPNVSSLRYSRSKVVYHVRLSASFWLIRSLPKRRRSPHPTTTTNYARTHVRVLSTIPSAALLQSHIYSSLLITLPFPHRRSASNQIRSVHTLGALVYYTLFAEMSSLSVTDVCMLSMRC